MKQSLVLKCSLGQLGGMTVRMDFKGIFIVFAGQNYNIKSAVTKTHTDGKLYSQPDSSKL